MLLKPSILLITASLFVACSSEKKLTSRKLLKEYALCSCITFSEKKENHSYSDGSIAVYRDIAGYPYTVYDKVDSMARKVSLDLKPFLFEEGTVKSMFINCFELYNSKRLDSLIKKSDKLIYK